jgi:hypothetical protein
VVFSFLLGGLTFLNTKGKLDFGIVELLGALSLAKLRCNSGSLDDLDARRPDPVARSHLIVHMFHSPI